MNTANNNSRTRATRDGWRPAPGSLATIAIIGSLSLYLFITSTFFPLEYWNVFDTKRIIQVVLFAALAIFAGVHPRLRSSTTLQICRLSKPNRYALALLFIIGIASSMRLPHPGYSLVDVSMLFVMLFLIAVTAAGRDHSKRIFDQWAVLILAAMGFAVFFQQLMGIIAGWAIGNEFSYNQALIHFGHPRFYNQLQTWTIPVIAALPWVFPKRRWIRPLCVALLGLQWFLVFMTAARGSFVGLITAMTLIALWLPAQRRYWLKSQVLGIFTGVLIYLSLFYLNEIIITKPGGFYAHSIGRPMATTSGRRMLWRLSYEDAIKNPLLGAGPGRFACGSEMRLPAHPHGFLFGVLGEWGFIALILILGFTISIAMRLLKTLRQTQNQSQTDPPISAMLAISLIAGGIHACLSGLLIMPASQVAMVLIAGWTLSLCAGTGSTSTNAANPNAGTRTPYAGAIAIFAGIFLAVSQAVFTLDEATRINDRERVMESRDKMLPRYWQHGKICKFVALIDQERPSD